MQQDFYDYSKEGERLFRFTSKGKKRIVKIVQFTETAHSNIINLGFGDLLPNNTIDDRVVSDNGDMKKVLATVIQIIEEFTAQFPHLKIGFAGSTSRRMAVYYRILKTHYPVFCKEFYISGLIAKKQGVQEVAFKPEIQRNYIAFFVKRKS